MFMISVGCSDRLVVAILIVTCTVSGRIYVEDENAAHLNDIGDDYLREGARCAQQIAPKATGEPEGGDH
jgi:hypothetical protein